MRWYPYKGYRIAVAGKRTFLENLDVAQFAPPDRRFGCVWEDEGKFRGYYETRYPGEVIDVDVGPFATEREARKAVTEGLVRTESFEVLGALL